MKATNDANYDYVVLQATENSIPFYESMGFVRVGAVTEVTEAEQNKSIFDQRSNSEASVQSLEDSPDQTNRIVLPDHIVVCDHFTYTVLKAGTSVNDLAKQFGVDSWDICYLNKSSYKGITPSSRLIKGTMLLIPSNDKADASKTEKSVTCASDGPRYYIAKENDTPRKIARLCNVNCIDLVEANKARLPGLLSNSRLKDGTKVRISHLDAPDIVNKPYAHWSFPDDDFEEGEPSYMMALKLNRRRGRLAQDTPVRDSMASSLSGYEPTTLLLPPSPTPTKQIIRPVDSSAKRKKLVFHPDEPKPPKKPMGAFFQFCAEQRSAQCSQLEGLPVPAASKYLADQWKGLAEEQKTAYINMSARAKDEYLAARANYEKEVAIFRSKYPPVEEETSDLSATPDTSSLGDDTGARRDLFNKVVKLKPQAVTEGCDYKYW